MCSIYKEVAEMNFQGILAVQRNEHMQALQVFHSGLTKLLDHRSRPSPSFSDKKAHASSEISKEKRNGKIVSSVALSESCYSTKHDEVFALFNRGLCLHPENPNVFADNQDFYESLVTGVIAYNIGLVHHVEGLQKGCTCLLTRALDFYSMAYGSLTSRTEFMAVNPMAMNLCLLALANNIGHCHAFFRSFRLTEICSEEISLRLSAMVPSHLFEGTMDEEYNVFILNICLFSESEFVSAPAA